MRKRLAGRVEAQKAAPGLLRGPRGQALSLLVGVHVARGGRCWVSAQGNPIGRTDEGEKGGAQAGSPLLA